MAEQSILAIDCGTQSLRALLFAPDGCLQQKAKVDYEPYESPKPGWAEQDPLVFWHSLCQACHELKEQDPECFRRVVGVGVTTQRDSMVCVDRQGTPLRPVITWLDQRKARCPYRPSPLMRLVYKMVGMNEPLAKTQADGKCNWIRQNQPDIWNRTFKYLQVSGYLNHRLTGRFVDSVASQIGHIPFHYKQRRWARPGELPQLLFPVPENKLPALVPPGEPVGTITQEAAEATGMAVDTPVIACGSDKGCETLGMGVLDTTMASLSFGTTATVQTTTKRYFEPIRFMPAYPAPMVGHYNPEVEIFRGFWMITWFKNEFGAHEIAEAKRRQVAPELVLNELLGQVPPGSMGLVVQPYWGPGLKHPSAKGAIIGFGDVHKRAHVYRAVIEGLGFGLLDGLHSIEAAGRFQTKRLAVSGGASQSDEICQISADIFDLPLVRGRTFETSGLGAAIVVAVGCGLHPSVAHAIRQMVHHDRTFEPNPAQVDSYERLYERVYKRMFRALDPLYHEIRDITGYPERLT